MKKIGGRMCRTERKGKVRRKKRSVQERGSVYEQHKIVCMGMGKMCGENGTSQSCVGIQKKES